MNKQIHFTEKASKPIGPYSQAVQVGDLLFISGCIALDPQTGELKNSSIEEETTQAMTNLKAILAAAGMDFSNVVKTTIFLKNFDDFGAMNGVYGSYFSSDYPARETVEVCRLPKDANVEISMIASR